MTSELTVAIHAAVYLAHKNAPQSSDEAGCQHLYPSRPRPQDHGGSVPVKYRRFPRGQLTAATA